MIHNPILRGFNPDPSIIRVGDDYYIATSTFEWFPGVQIHHSRDLAHWRLIGRPLNRASQLDMRGEPDSCGVWAPCLTHADGLFHLVYTDVKRFGRTTTAGASGASLRDFHNYLVTSDRIDGEWSDPVFLNSSGFDPSLFHDDDGRKYLVNMLWDHRPGYNRFGGIVLQEYSAAQQGLVGGRHNIFTGTALGFTEAPHLYRRDGWYYLLTAEGGTGWGHAVTMARSRSLLGPYELHPDVHILTARHRPDVALQRAGHADLVETHSGETYMVYLCGRPLGNRGRCTLGRETAIQPMRWGSDGWLRTMDGGGIPVVDVPAPADLAPQSYPLEPEREEFDSDGLPLAFQWLRSPRAAALFSLRARKGHLRLYGRETLGSSFEQALVARRQQAHCFSASTILEFEPEHFQQMAGLICYYNSTKFHYLYVSRDEGGKHLRVMSALPDQVTADAFTPPIAIPSGSAIELRAEVDYERLNFAYRLRGGAWQWLAQQFDASILSDEASAPGLPNFTGAFVGMACQDLAGTARPADFDWFEYREREYVADVGRLSTDDVAGTSLPSVQADETDGRRRSSLDKMRNVMRAAVNAIALLLIVTGQAEAQPGVLTKELLVAYTPEWKGERFSDGRPKVPDAILERMKLVTLEEAWAVVSGAGFSHQYDDKWLSIHPDKVLVGRALTSQWLPGRPDIQRVIEAKGREQGRIGGTNAWPVDMLQPRDVYVSDHFGLKENGASVGDNVGSAIYAKSGNGIVYDGAVRDINGLRELENFISFVRSYDPSHHIGNASAGARLNSTMIGINVPIRIGGALVMPGDVVLGRDGGVIFIPPQLAERVVQSSEITRLRDDFGHARLRAGVYTAGQIDGRWTEAIEADFTRWLRENIDRLPVGRAQIEEILRQR